jgi:hypothetical protein
MGAFLLGYCHTIRHTNIYHELLRKRIDMGKRKYGQANSSDQRYDQRGRQGGLRIHVPATDRGAAERVNVSAEPIAAPHRLKIVYRNIDEIRPNPRNPRKHSRRQIKKLARIIQHQGCNVPLLLDRYDNLLAGHARFEACRLLGLTEIPTICLEHLNERQAQAFMLADNRLAELSEWDDRLLAEHLKELSLALDFEIELSGFEVGEIDLFIESLNSASEKEPDAADALPQMPTSKLPVTRAGDLWLLGEHRILCGNALEESTYVVLMNGKFAAMVLSDPPYNVRIAGNVSGLGRIQHRDFVMASGDMSEAEFTLFLSRVCRLFARHSKDGSLHYLFIDWRHVGEMIAAGKVAYTELKNIAVWVKNTPGMGSFYRSQHELVAIFKSGRGPHRNNVQLGEYGRNRSNVWPYPSINSFGRAGEEGNLLATHPTIKPVALLGDATWTAPPAATSSSTASSAAVQP